MTMAAIATFALLALLPWVDGCTDQNCNIDPFPARVIREVVISHGKAGASTSWRDAPWSDPEQAFKQDIKHAWASGIFPNGVRTPCPHLIWYDFPLERAFIPAEVSFRVRQDTAGGLAHGPTKWQFVGSNDDNCDAKGGWAILCEDLSGTTFKTKGDTKYCVVPARMIRKFRCLGMRILQTGNGLEASVQSMRFWEKVVD